MKTFYTDIKTTERVQKRDYVSRENVGVLG